MGSRVALVAALALVSLMTAAARAQVVPPSEQPGRERERFIQPPAAQAQPGGPVVTLPSTVAPKGAEKVFLLVRGVKITGSTVYQPKDFAPLYRGWVGRRVSLAAVYALAQEITTKYGNDGYVLSRAVVPPQQLNQSGAIVHIEIVEGYIDKVAWPPQLSRYHDFFTDYAAKITAQRPVNIRTIERYLLLAGDLPGLKFKTSLRAVQTEPRRRDAGGRSRPKSVSTPTPNLTTAARRRAGRLNISVRRRSTTRSDSMMR